MMTERTKNDRKEDGELQQGQGEGMTEKKKNDNRDKGNGECR